MSTRSYRLTVLGCAMSWFMLGLHVPTLHAITHHGRAVHWPVVAGVTFLLAAGIAAAWVLLRAPQRRAA